MKNLIIAFLVAVIFFGFTFKVSKDIAVNINESGSEVFLQLVSG